MAALFVAALCAHPARAQNEPLSVLTAPQLPPAKWFASTDSKHRNEDYLLLKPGERRRIPLAEGRLVRLWATASLPEKIELKLESGGRLSGFETDLLRGGKAVRGQLLYKAFTFYPAPIEKQGLSQAIIVSNRDTQPNKFFYQATIRPESPALRGPVFSGPSQTQPNEIEMQGKTPYVGFWRANEKVPATGVLTEIELRFKPATPSSWNGLTLSLAPDPNNPSYQFELPLPALTGIFGPHKTQNAFWSFDGQSLHIRFPIPFKRGAELFLRNENDNRVRIFTRTSFRPTTALWPYQFAAAYGATRSQNGQPIPVLRVQGEGAFVGLVMAIRPTSDSSRRAFAYLEGNETIAADGVKYEGTGTEDFFNSAWYFPDKPFDSPFAGMMFKSAQPPQVAAYRLMLHDAVPFKKTLSFDFEHGSGNNDADLEYRWAAFWYQKAPLHFQIKDALAVEGVSSAAPLPAMTPEREAHLDHLQIIVNASIGVLTAFLGVLFVAYLKRRPS